MSIEPEPVIVLTAAQRRQLVAVIVAALRRAHARRPLSTADRRRALCDRFLT